MTKANTDWNSVETWQKLVAAIVATGVKIDTRATAKYFGTTYDTVENRMRKIKVEAKALQDDSPSDTTAGPSPRYKASVADASTKSRKKGNLNVIRGGRVAKKTNNRKGKATRLQGHDSEDDDPEAPGEDADQSANDEV